MRREPSACAARVQQQLGTGGGGTRAAALQWRRWRRAQKDALRAPSSSRACAEDKTLPRSPPAVAAGGCAVIMPGGDHTKHSRLCCWLAAASCCVPAAAAATSPSSSHFSAASYKKMGGWSAGPPSASPRRVARAPTSRLAWVVQMMMTPSRRPRERPSIDDNVAAADPIDDMRLPPSSRQVGAPASAHLPPLGAAQLRPATPRRERGKRPSATNGDQRRA